jgi:hypothetical protein
VIVDTVPPTVAITSPASGSAVKGTITVTSQLADEHGIAYVMLFVDGSFKGSSQTPPFSLPLDTAQIAGGNVHALTIVAADNATNSTTSAAVTITVDTQPPQVKITSPANGSTERGSVMVTVGASDNTAVAQAELLVDGVLHATSTVAPYVFTVDTAGLSSGAHRLEAAATDTAGNRRVSTPVTITSDNQAPSVAISAPADGSQVHGSLQVTVNASDNLVVAGVELLVDGAVIATSATAPYVFTVETTALAMGTHTLEAAASDAAGNRTVSAPVTFVSDNEPPVATVTAPAAGATVRGTTTVVITASDQGSGIASVELLIDGQARATLTSPYAWDWNTTVEALGSHLLAARIRDLAGNEVTGPAVEVIVAAPYQYVWTEAEAGAVNGPMQLGSDGAASGTKFIAVALGNNSPNSAPATGRASYAFTVAAAGSYRVWGRVSAATTSDDSFWVRIDGAPFIKWNDIVNGVAWHWDSVHDSDQMNQVVSFALTAGAHTLELAYREDGAKLDRLLVTSDPGFDPTGHEPSRPLAAATDLVATSGPGRVSLGWTPSAGATSYELWRTPTPGGLYPTLIGSSAGPSAVDTQVTGATQYCYIVNARNAAGMSLPSAEACATTPALFYLAKEAESGTLTSPMKILNDATASGGKYITVAAGNNSPNGAPTAGRASFVFNIPVAGAYKVWARAIAPTANDDSFWVRVDNGTFIKWSNVALGASWHWDFVSNGDRGNQVVTFNLTPGNHTLQFAYREDGARLDRVLMTNDAAFAPSGVGP